MIIKSLFSRKGIWAAYYLSYFKMHFVNKLPMQQVRGGMSSSRDNVSKTRARLPYATVEHWLMLLLLLLEQ